MKLDPWLRTFTPSGNEMVRAYSPAAGAPRVENRLDEQKPVLVSSLCMLHCRNCNGHVC